MSDSHAVEILHSMSDLARRRAPRHGRNWGRETFLEIGGNLPASRNKFKGENACELLAALDRLDMGTVDRILDFWVWYRTLPFTDGEDLTPEEVYRALFAYSDLLVYGVAVQVGHRAAETAARELARAHFAWLLLGIGPTPRRVLDHQQGARGGLVLLGEGKPAKGDLPYIVQPGLRGWIRDNKTGEFRFTERTALAVAVCHGIGRKVPKGAGALEQEILAGFDLRWPGLGPWGLTPQEEVSAKLFAASPADPDLASDIVPWLLPPSLPCRFDRFADGACVGLLEADSPSSTDPVVIDAVYANGETRKASCEDGRRSSVSRQIGVEETDAYSARFVSGGQPVRIAKPAAPESYSVLCDGRRVWLVEGGASNPEVVTPPAEVPLPPAKKPRRKKRFGFS